MGIDRRLLASFDWILLFNILAIISLGLVILYSAGYNPDSNGILVFGYNLPIKSAAFAKQLTYLALGFFIFLFTLFIPPSFLQKIAYPLFIISFLALIFVLTLGLLSHGSKRWFDLGFIHVQPSEFAKFSLILALAKSLSSKSYKIGGYKLRNLFFPFILIFLPAALILKQPDLGTALSVIVIGCSMILFFGINLRSLILIFILSCFVVPSSWYWLLKPYQKRRVMALINPEADPLGSGYHIIQSKIAVGSGGLFGKGFLNGTQAQLEFLPERSTDFVFSVLAEEWGFAGCILVLLLYFSLMNRLLRVAYQTKDNFSCLLVVGITAMVFFHVVINVGMVLGLFPVVGLPLPLFSYGGSSLLLTTFSMGIVMGISMRRFSYFSGTY